jgi:nitrate/nitrite transporter NarK
VNAKETFALIVRVIGLLGVIYLVRRIVKVGIDDLVLLIIRVVCALIGLYFVRGAPLLVKFAYPEKPAGSAPHSA